MSIDFQCGRCGKRYRTGDESAGKTARCKQCGDPIVVPRPGDADDDGEVIELVEETAPARSPIPGRLAPPGLAPRRGGGPDVAETAAGAARNPLAWGRPAPGGASASGTSSRPGAPGGARAAEPSRALRWLKGAAAGLFCIAMLGLRVYSRWDRQQGRQAVADAPATAPEAPIASVPAAASTAPRRPGPIPRFPGRGRGRQIEPGVVFHEITLNTGPDAQPPPGHTGKLWLYLPEAQAEPRSLPCVLIAGAGSNLISGMDLGDADRPEHLPYVHAGFAVVAYEIDGKLPGGVKEADEAQLQRAARQFLRARAGLDNAWIAMNYATTQVGEVDPGAIFAAGHSSAGTLAMLFAEHEPRLRGGVAYAPAIDLEARFGAEGMQALRALGVAALATDYSPKANEARLTCPLFLFTARDDSNVPAALAEASAARLRALGKDVTLELVPTGDHAGALFDEGIPRAIRWMAARSGRTIEPGR